MTQQAQGPKSSRASGPRSTVHGGPRIADTAEQHRGRRSDKTLGRSAPHLRVDLDFDARTMSVGPTATQTTGGPSPTPTRAQCAQWCDRVVRRRAAQCLRDAVSRYRRWTSATQAPSGHMQARVPALMAVNRPTARGAFGVASRALPMCREGPALPQIWHRRPPQRRRGDAEQMHESCKRHSFQHHDLQVYFRTEGARGVLRHLIPWSDPTSELRGPHPW